MEQNWVHKATFGHDFKSKVIRFYLDFLEPWWDIILKPLLLVLLVAAGVYWYFGVYQSDIAKVKRGVLKFDKSRTVNEALSTNLKNLKWTKYTNKKKQTVVKATGIWKSDARYFHPGLLPFFIVRSGNRVEAYFIMNKDGVFSFASGFSFAGGKVTSTSNDLCFGKDDTVTSELLDFMELEGGFLGVLYD